eukprot:CAMPEP_0114521622 /NCGR_PEP_ID=MMETSP0109-20121206/20283_1 /TAXON_ID=29199 /ORGANISM="Chlorarachnion reptans, Strain CCCM449" /LENGTH=657 /DNA_ID=CAMNT_0001702737 /DNA_START=322 /DNA_END=2296 /DNA_ORIENTATION=+
MSATETRSVEELLELFLNSANEKQDFSAAQKKCNDLFARDYVFRTIDNADGTFCKSYPPELIIIQKSKDSGAPTNAVQALTDRFRQGRFARVRGRFPIPVILWKGKNICRSSTISVQAELLLNTSRDRLRSLGNKYFNGDTDGEKISYTLDAQRKSDTAILQELDVTCICDLMVEQHKTKMGVVCTSSEKAEAEKSENDLYDEFHIQAMPYPGCEFFRLFKDNKHCGKNLKFNWNEKYIDAKLSTPPFHHLNLNWSDYKSWDIILLTQNYFRLVMEHLVSSKGGVLVHCISGWDRTPLFISLLRLSLWADGEIHNNLDAEEILYLTLAYDWMLFSHLLDDRLAKGEDIFFFCFYMLPFLTGSEFSVHARLKNDEPTSDFEVQETTKNGKTSQGVSNGSAQLQDSINETIANEPDASVQKNFTKQTIRGFTISPEPQKSNVKFSNGDDVKGNPISSGLQTNFAKSPIHEKERDNRQNSKTADSTETITKTCILGTEESEAPLDENQRSRYSPYFKSKSAEHSEPSPILRIHEDQPTSSIPTGPGTRISHTSSISSDTPEQKVGSWQFVSRDIDRSPLESCRKAHATEQIGESMSAKSPFCNDHKRETKEKAAKLSASCGHSDSAPDLRLDDRKNDPVLKEATLGKKGHYSFGGEKKGL